MRVGFDGANGDNFSLMKDYRIAAREWGRKY